MKFKLTLEMDERDARTHQGAIVALFADIGGLATEEEEDRSGKAMTLMTEFVDRYPCHFVEVEFTNLIVTVN